MTYGASRIYPCAYCGAPDARGADHQRGCPKLPPVTPERLRAIAQACERGWRIAAAERAEGRAEKKQREARHAAEQVRRFSQSEARL